MATVSQTQNERLASFLLNLECLDAAGRVLAFKSEAAETHGIFSTTFGEFDEALATSINLHGITATGASRSEAIRNWTKTALAVSPLVEDDGFITVFPPLDGASDQSRNGATTSKSKGAA